MPKRSSIKISAYKLLKYLRREELIYREGHRHGKMNDRALTIASALLPVIGKVERMRNKAKRKRERRE